MHDDGDDDDGDDDDTMMTMMVVVIMMNLAIAGCAFRWLIIRLDQSS